MVEFDPRTSTTIFHLKSGAVVKIREDEDGGLEIRETTHRYLNIKPTARNAMYLELEDPAAAPPVFDLPVRQTADLAEGPLLQWDVPMSPRNIKNAPVKWVLVDARTPEHAIEKAIAVCPGHVWGMPQRHEHEDCCK